MHREGVRRAEAQLELNLARDAKNNKKAFYRFVSQKRRVRESVPHLMNKNGKLLTTDKENTEVLNNFLPLSSLATTLPTPFKWMDHKTGTGGAKSIPL